MVSHLTRRGRKRRRIRSISLGTYRRLYSLGGEHVQQVLRGVIERALSGAGALGSRVHAV